MLSHLSAEKQKLQKTDIRIFLFAHLALQGNGVVGAVFPGPRCACPGLSSLSPAGRYRRTDLWIALVIASLGLSRRSENLPQSLSPFKTTPCPFS